MTREVIQISIFEEPKISQSDNCGNVKINKREYNRLRKAAQLWERYQSAFIHAVVTYPATAYGGIGNAPLATFDMPLQNHLVIDVNSLVDEMLGSGVPTVVTLKIDDRIVSQKKINK